MDSTFIAETVDALTGRWWVPVTRGIAAIAFGILALVSPSIGLMSLVIMWGVYAIIDGISNLALAAWSGSAGGRWGWLMFEGLISIGAGVLTFAYPGITTMVLLLVIAVWAVLTGVMEIGAALEFRHIVKGAWLLGLCGVLSIAFGIILMASPSNGALAVVWLIAVYAILFGLALLALGLRLRALRRSGERAFAATHTPTPA